MKSYYRFMLGYKRIHAELGYKGNFVGSGCLGSGFGQVQRAFAGELAAK